MAEDPTFRVKTDQADRRSRHLRHGRAAPRDHRRPPQARVQRRGEVGRPQVAYKETLTRPADGEMKYAKQTGGRGQFGHVKIHLYPGRARRRATSSRTRSAAARFRRSSSSRSTRASRKRSRAASSPATRSTTCGSSSTTVRITTSTRRKWRSRSPARWRSRTPRRRRSRCCSSRSCGSRSWCPRSTWATSWATCRAAAATSSRRKIAAGRRSSTRACRSSEMFGYATDLRSRTQGRATYSMHFDRYEPAPNNVSEEVVARVQGKT